MQKASYQLTIFLIVAIVLITTMVAFIITVLYFYRKKQIDFEKNLAKTRLDHEKEILATQVEIQEQTFQHISKEIHDNINLSLTLTKLNLHTLDWTQQEKAEQKIKNSIDLLSTSITQLNDLSKSLDTDTITRHSLLMALEEERQRINKTDCIYINYEVLGTPVYMNNQAEIVIFRIIQESLNNIIKHARAKTADLLLNYHPGYLEVTISDEGKGFDPSQQPKVGHAGLRNMENRVKLLGGSMQIQSETGKGSRLNFFIPFEKL
ncbi:MAG: hypothetical protein IPG86_00765 [Chitinophagaceae bacterium]|nr:hypothetical protein [Chitinophagaceae bacterium]